jgi:enolase
MPTIQSVKGLEILDSRGRPTVKAYLKLADNITANASVPSGASTGKSEAQELRDGGLRYHGYGCKNAVRQINETINLNISNKKFDNQLVLDHALIDLDGTSNKSMLGANSILAVSLAYSRAMSALQQLPLYHYFSSLLEQPIQYMPRPTINLFSGGKHAGGQIPIQDLLIVPMQSTTSEVLECAYAVYQAAVKLCQQQYQMRALTADEGGLAPPFSSTNEMFEMAIRSIESSGYHPGLDVKLAVDVAASHFCRDEQYYVTEDGLSGEYMIRLLTDWVAKYPIVSLEDGLAEEDWKHWTMLQQAIGTECLVLGDDLLCTNPVRIKKAIDQNSANALLLKVNQIGTVSEALEAMKIAREASWQVTISARSGETEDDWLADLAVGWQADYIKIGSITQSERLSKYNRLLEIEQELNLKIKN